MNGLIVGSFVLLVVLVMSLIYRKMFEKDEIKNIFKD